MAKKRTIAEQFEKRLQKKDVCLEALDQAVELKFYGRDGVITLSRRCADAIFERTEELEAICARACSKGMTLMLYFEDGSALVFVAPARGAAKPLAKEREGNQPCRKLPIAHLR